MGRNTIRPIRGFSSAFEALIDAAPVATTTEKSVAQGWRGALELHFKATVKRTVLGHRKHVGPIMVQSPFYPEGSVCHLYLLHPPGGVVGGDELLQYVRVDPNAEVLLTTPAATKLYRSAGPQARLETRLVVAPRAALEWLPLETIVFDRARASQRTRIDLQPDSRFLGWEMHCFGRPASQDWFERGLLRQDFELWLGDRPLVVDRNLIEGGGRLYREKWGFGGQISSSTLMAYPFDAADLATMRELSSRHDDVRSGFSCVDDVLVVRSLACDMQRLRRFGFDLWQLLRPIVIGRPPATPRIWST